MTREVRIGDHVVGGGNRPFFVAELGVCHRGSVAVAKDNAKAAAEAGADCIKTELFYETEVYDPSAVKTFSTRSGKKAVPLIEHMRRYQFTLEEHHEVKRFADELGLPFMATAHDRKRVDFLEEIGAEAIKIASPDIVHYPLIRYAAASGLALFLDTGGAYPWEVDMAVKAARDAGGQRVVVNHNPKGHPAPAQNHNLRMIRRHQRVLDLPAGLADHYDGYEMLYAAVAAGADTVEKPISEDRFIEECEHIWAISRDDLKDVIATVHAFHAALGTDAMPQAPGLRPESPHRVALVARNDMAAGDVLTLDSVAFGKPRLGIGVEHWDALEGKRLAVARKSGDFIGYGDIAEEE